MEIYSEEAKIKFKIIEETLSNDNNVLNIKQMCQMAGVSRSGYYSYIKSKPSRDDKELQDQKDFELILDAYNFKGYKKGYRSIYMRLIHKGIRMNHKKILRLMNKYNLHCPIRKINPYKQMAKAKKEHATKQNIVDRKFKAYGPRKILLTDITYLFIDNQKIIYLSVIKYAYTNEVLSAVCSESLEVDFVLETMNNLIDDYGDQIDKHKVLIHSDQGVHYTSKKFQELVSNYEIRQSMSRRGNCWDNAPQESFFGHMKDEINLKGCKTLEHVKTVIEEYIEYYNNDRYQWNLAKLAPTQFYHFITTGVYPLAPMIKAPKIKSFKKLIIPYDTDIVQDEEVSDSQED